MPEGKVLKQPEKTTKWKEGNKTKPHYEVSNSQNFMADVTSTLILKKSFHIAGNQNPDVTFFFFFLEAKFYQDTKIFKKKIWSLDFCLDFFLCSCSLTQQGGQRTGLWNYLLGGIINWKVSCSKVKVHLLTPSQVFFRLAATYGKL